MARKCSQPLPSPVRDVIVGKPEPTGLAFGLAHPRKLQTVKGFGSKKRIPKRRGNRSTLVALPESIVQDSGPTERRFLT